MALLKICSRLTVRCRIIIAKNAVPIIIYHDLTYDIQEYDKVATTTTVPGPNTGEICTLSNLSHGRASLFRIVLV
jgi:hypothetical protein